MKVKYIIHEYSDIFEFDDDTTEAEIEDDFQDWLEEAVESDWSIVY